MAVLKIKKKREDYKLVGINLPPPEHNYLTLYTLAKGVPKARILKMLITGWIDVQKKKNPDDVLLSEIVHRINLHRKVKKKIGDRLSLGEYKESIEEELTKKGLPQDYIEYILQEIE